MKRTLVTLSMLLVGFALLFAAGQSDGPKGGVSGGVSITYGIWDATQRKAAETLIRAFEERNPGLQVELMVVPWKDYWTKLTAAVAGGRAFDTFWMNGPFFPEYAENGVIRSMGEEYEKAGIPVGRYPEALVSLYTHKGEVYAYPKDFDTIGLFYNRDHFDAAGLSYPDENWTWDELKSAAESLTSEEVWGFASVTGDQAGWWNFIFQNNGKLLSEDLSEVLVGKGKSREALEFLYSFIEQGLSPDDSTMQSIDPWVQLFPSGKLAMITAGSWMCKTYEQAEFSIDVAPLPFRERRACIIHGVANVVWSGSDHPQEAARWVVFLASEEGQSILADTGSVIPAYQGKQDSWVASLPDMNVQVLIQATEYAIPYPASVKGMEWNWKIQDVLSDIWNGNLPFDEGMEKITEVGNKALQATQ